MENMDNLKGLEKLFGKVVKCGLQDGTTFSSKLIDIQGNLLIFENSSGEILADDISTIVSIVETRSARSKATTVPVIPRPTVI